jgi:protein-L-isoaspartate(D-aspartate) O-methyltransferase
MMLDQADARRLMIERQIARRGIRDERVLNAMREVPREAFVSAEMAEFAYEDSPLPIQAGQTISQPYIVALMLQAAELQPDSRALEIGAGSGYSAAVLSRLCREVFTIERHAELADLAQERLEALGYDNVTVRIGDGTTGWPEHAPFNAIIAAAGGPSVPDPLRVQLAEGGRLIIPVGATKHGQRLIRLIRLSNGEFNQEVLGGVSFVPLIGAHGWSEDDIAGKRMTIGKRGVRKIG